MRLNELKDDLTPIRNQIAKNCTQILGLMEKTNGCLMSGIRGDVTGFPIFKKQTPINRYPQTTFIQYQTAIDKRLADAGFKALRSNSIFCRNKVSNAYGSPYLILPINGFDYTYGPYVDLTLHFELDQPRNYKFANKNAEQFKIDLFSQMPANEFCSKYVFKHSDLEYALTTQYFEIYIHGVYIAVSLKWDATYTSNLPEKILGPLLPHFPFKHLHL